MMILIMDFKIPLERLSDGMEKPSPLMACDETCRRAQVESLSRVGEGLGEGEKTDATANG
jgi:hypothetical protein